MMPDPVSETSPASTMHETARNTCQGRVELCVGHFEAVEKV